MISFHHKLYIKGRPPGIYLHKFKFPLDWSIAFSPTHWSNEDTNARVYSTHCLKYVYSRYKDSRKEKCLTVLIQLLAGNLMHVHANYNFDRVILWFSFLNLYTKFSD